MNQSGMPRGYYMAPDSLEESFVPPNRVRFQLPEDCPTQLEVNETLNKSEKRKIENDTKMDTEIPRPKKIGITPEIWDMQLQTEKCIAELENMKLTNYKLRLEILEKERRLGLSPSEFTKDLKYKLNQNEL